MKQKNPTTPTQQQQTFRDLGIWETKRQKKKSKHTHSLPTHVFAAVTSHTKLLTLHFQCTSLIREPRQSIPSAKLRHKQGENCWLLRIWTHHTFQA